MGKKHQKKSRGQPQPVSAVGPANKARRPVEAVTEELARQIRAAHSTGAWGKVIALWQQVAGTKGHRQPTDPDLTALAADAYYQHGKALSGKGNPGAAVSQFGAAVALNPGRSQYQYHLALTRHRNGQWQDAVQGYRAVLRLEPGDQTAAYHLCLACLQSGLECQPGGALDSALECLQQHATSEPLSWRIRRVQAWRTYVRSGSTAELAAIHASARYPEPALALEAALVALSEGKAEGARRRLPDPTDSPGDSLSACVEALRTLLSARAGHHRQATALAACLMETKPLPGGPHRDLIDSVRMRALWEAGQAAWLNGEPASAAPLWEAALALSPRNISLRLNLALALDATGSTRAGQHWHELARTWERTAQRKEAQGASSHRLAAALAYHRAGRAAIPGGNWQEARRLMERAIALAPENTEILYDLAHLAIIGGDHAWLRSRAQTLRELLRDDASRLTALGHLCEEAGMTDDVEPIWLRLLELDPEHECAGEHLVSLYEDRGEKAWAAGKAADAAAYFERGLALVPGSRRLHIWLGGISLLQGDRQRAATAFAVGRTGDDDPELIAYADVAVGKHLLREGLRHDAEAAFQRGLQSHRSADTYLGIGLAHLAAADQESATRQFWEAGRRSDFDPNIMMTALDALYKQRAYAAAQELVLAALSTHPEDHNLWMVRSITEFELKGPQMDKSVVRKARLLALQERDRGAVQALDQILSVI